MGLALTLNLLPKRSGHRPALTWRRCAFCDTKQAGAWYAKRKGADAVYDANGKLIPWEPKRT